MKHKTNMGDPAVRRLNFWRRLFHHAALGLASACLLYAEAFFLPGTLLVVLYLLAGVQILAFAAEGRRWVLPSWGANLLAGAVAGGGVAWIAAELNRPDSVLASLPLPVGLLPYIGPILIGLLVVKLFRPPTPRDFWLLQGVGALQVALACVLATNPDSGILFAGLLAAYLACALGRLALHYFEEEHRAGDSPAPGDSAASAKDRMPFAYFMSPFCLRWSLAVVALAAPLFLLTPRIQGPSWDSSVMAGQSVDGTGGRAVFSQQIDLNRDGPVRLTDEEVFRVAVEAAPDHAVPILPADQYWRSNVLDAYDRGNWYNREVKEQSNIGQRPSPAALDLVPGRYRLAFTVGPHTSGFFLAEPVIAGLDSQRSTPVDATGLTATLPLSVSTRGPVLPRLYSVVREYHYRQTADPANDANRIPTTDLGLYTKGLRSANVPGIAEWTSALLQRMAADPTYRLSPADVRLGVKPGHTVPSLPESAHERVGQALTAYLGGSGEYTYTLDLRRQSPSLDPVMDFLINTKQGHCERFASALALMLRSQGIPSRIVVGFRGASDPANNVYIIRQNHAHAWVQMFTPQHRAKPQDTGEWITLDPTPAAEPTAPIPYSLWEWWQESQRTSQELWGGLVVNYNAQQQADLWTRLGSPTATTVFMTIGMSLPLLAAAAALTWFALHWRFRVRGQDAAALTAPAAFGYAQLLALLARHAGLRIRIGQTPREFAAEGRRFLLAALPTQPFADLPDEIVDHLYQVHFGGHFLTAEENAVGATRLDQLATVLKSGRG